MKAVLQPPPRVPSTGRIVMGRATFCFRFRPFLANLRETPDAVAFVERGMVGGLMLALSFPAMVAALVIVYPVHTRITGGSTLPFWPIGALLTAMLTVAALVVGYVRWRRRSVHINKISGSVRVEVRTLVARGDWTFAANEVWLLLHPVTDGAMQRGGPQQYTAALLWTPAGPICLGFDRSEEALHTWLRNLPPAMRRIKSATGAPIFSYTVWGGRTWIDPAEN